MSLRHKKILFLVFSFVSFPSPWVISVLFSACLYCFPKTFSLALSVFPEQEIWVWFDCLISRPAELRSSTVFSEIFRLRSLLRNRRFLASRSWCCVLCLARAAVSTWVGEHISRVGLIGEALDIGLLEHERDISPVSKASLSFCLRQRYYPDISSFASSLELLLDATSPYA